MTQFVESIDFKELITVLPHLHWHAGISEADHYHENGLME